MKNITLILLALVSLAACNNKKSTADNHAGADTSHHDVANKNLMMQAMDESMLAMHKAKQTGNADYDFASMMIPHHEGAIVMAEGVLKQSKSPALRQFAEKVIKAQQGEIALLSKFLETADQTPSKEAEQFKKDLNGSMKPMMDGMANTVLTGKVDHDFVTLMIPHHQSAVDMAKAYLPYAQHTQIKSMAKEIISAQETEIKWLQQQLH